MASGLPPADNSIPRDFRAAAAYLHENRARKGLVQRRGALVVKLRDVLRGREGVLHGGGFAGDLSARAGITTEWVRERIVAAACRAICRQDIRSKIAPPLIAL